MFSTVVLYMIKATAADKRNDFNQQKLNEFRFFYNQGQWKAMPPLHHSYRYPSPQNRGYDGVPAPIPIGGHISAGAESVHC